MGIGTRLEQFRYTGLADLDHCGPRCICTATAVEVWRVGSRAGEFDVTETGDMHLIHLETPSDIIATASNGLPPAAGLELTVGQSQSVGFGRSGTCSNGCRRETWMCSGIRSFIATLRDGIACGCM